MSFRFRKIYADVVAGDGTVYIAYLVWVEAWGLRTAFATVEIYSPDGRREVLRAISPAPVPRPLPTEAPVELRLDFPDGSFSLRYEPVHPPWTPAGDSATEGLEWSVRIPRAAVTGQWSGSIKRPDLIGTGYVDWVQLTRVTRWLGIRTLEWGRVHLPESTMIFTGVRTRSRGWWRRVAHWSRLESVAPLVLEDFRLEPRGNALHAEFPDPEWSDGNRSTIVLNRERVLHSGSALDVTRASGLLERIAFTLATGKTEEDRWLSRAYSLAQPDSVGFAVHEVVRFGR